MPGPYVDLEFYGAVDLRARKIAEKIAARQLKPATAQLSYVVTEAERLAHAAGLGIGSGDIRGSAVSEIFDCLETRLDELLHGREELSAVMRDRPNLWERFMVEAPLGWYAQLAAETLSKMPEIRGQVLELGAGVGNVSRLISGFTNPSLYFRTDLNIKLLKAAGLPSQIAYFDFNRRGNWKEMDLVFAVNALHCANDKKAALGNIHEILKPGGAILLGEGAPESLPGVPWSLNYLCGFFDGWWNEGGFLEPLRWEMLLRESGFTDIRKVELGAGKLELGGLVWARKA